MLRSGHSGTRRVIAADVDLVDISAPARVAPGIHGIRECQ
jgi:hypothetical protein